jgi:hypothetical protein
MPAFESLPLLRTRPAFFILGLVLTLMAGSCRHPAPPLFERLLPDHTGWWNSLAAGDFDLDGDTDYLAGNKFKMAALPALAQLAPVYGMLVDDVNQDGHADVLLTGNDYGTEVFTGRYDAFVGLYLQGTGRGTFIPRPLRESGFYVPGDAKGAAALYGTRGEKILVVSQNQDSLKVFARSGAAQAAERKSRTVALLPADAWAVVTYRNGKKERREFYYGSAFLSQSARRFQVTPAMTSVVVFDYTSKSRKI